VAASAVMRSGPRWDAALTVPCPHETLLPQQAGRVRSHGRRGTCLAQDPFGHSRQGASVQLGGAAHLPVCLASLRLPSAIFSTFRRRQLSCMLLCSALQGCNLQHGIMLATCITLAVRPSARQGSEQRRAPVCCDYSSGDAFFWMAVCFVISDEHTASVRGADVNSGAILFSQLC
jgi:hypothetical protein